MIRHFNKKYIPSHSRFFCQSSRFCNYSKIHNILDIVQSTRYTFYSTVFTTLIFIASINDLNQLPNENYNFTNVIIYNITKAYIIGSTFPISFPIISLKEIYKNKISKNN
jgi:hypothetical protein